VCTARDKKFSACPFAGSVVVRHCSRDSMFGVLAEFPTCDRQTDTRQQHRPIRAVARFPLDPRGNSRLILTELLVTGPSGPPNGSVTLSYVGVVCNARGRHHGYKI